MVETLQSALQTFAQLTGLDASELMGYAEEDQIGGVHTGWPVGSIWEVEGKFLYAVIRALNIKKVLEIGTNYGCSAAHMLAAVKANGGKVTSIDVNAGAGSLIPDDLRDAWEFIATDAVEWTAKTRRKFDMVFEDGPHSREFTEAVLRNLDKSVTTLFVSHDSEHFIVGQDIRTAWSAVYGEHGYTSMLIEPSDCGLAYRVP